MSQIVIFDTTLRDGCQAKNFDLSVTDRVRIALELDKLKVDFFEGGWPGTNSTADDFFKEIRNYELSHAILTAFGTTHNPTLSPEIDPSFKNLLASGAKAFCIFGKTWDQQVLEVLDISLDDHLEIITASLNYLREHASHLFYDAEHFFDGFKANQEYALLTLEAAVAGGVDCVVLCDTNGGTLAHEIPAIIQVVKKRLGDKVQIGIHAHNDSEGAVQNSLTAVACGITHVQGTINGVGERCGNANLCSIIPALTLKMGLECNAKPNMVTEISRFAAEIANLSHNEQQPYTGQAAFAHKAGLHVQAVRHRPMFYEHVDPESVGNERHILASDQSGRANVVMKAKEFGIHLELNDQVVARIVREMKDLESRGYKFEAADASLELLVRKAMSYTPAFFDFISFRVITVKEQGDESANEASIQIEVAGQKVHTAALGDGPVNALDNALRKALIGHYPSIASMNLVDFKVRVLQGQIGTGAPVRVLITFKNGHGEWSTVGAGTDVIEVCWHVLVEGYNYHFMKTAEIEK